MAVGMESTPPEGPRSAQRRTHPAHGERRIEAKPRRLEAYVVCLRPRCGYYAAFVDLRESPADCPRCGGPLQRECRACGMLLRSSSFACQNCGRPIGRIDR
jgi:hypothetical protein